MSFRLLKYAPKKGFNRKPGECDSLLNTSPVLVTGSEKTRTGYSTATVPAIDGAATGITGKIWRTASTETPSAKEVWFLFGTIAGTKKLLTQPWYGYAGGTKQWNNTWLDFAEYFDFDSDITLGASTIVITGSDAKGFKTEDHYYDAWRLVDTSVSSSDFVKSSAYSAAAGGTTTLTIVGDHTGGSGIWSNADSFRLRRFFHSEDAVYEPTIDFPTVTAINGIFRVSFGASGSNPIWYGYISRTFFAGDSTNKFTMAGIYADYRECTNVITGIGATPTASAIAGTELGLDEGKTYWVALGVVYDGFQYSQIVTASIQGTYVSAAGNKITIVGTSPIGRVSRRVSSYFLAVAQDNGDTTSSGRQNPFRYLQSLDAMSLTVDCTFDQSVVMDKTVFNGRGNFWSKLSGYGEGVNIMYTFDHEISTGERQWLARVSGDTDNIYTNPKTSDGIVQPDIFPDEQERYKHRVLWGDTSFITGISTNERGRIISLKDRALVDIGVQELSDNSLVLQSNIVSTQVGCASKTGFLQTPYGLFFAGYDDIYLYDSSGLHNLTFDDWGDTYRAISSATKQAAIAWYRVEDNSISFQLGNDAYVYFMSVQSWRKHTYASPVVYYTVKRDNSIVWTKSDGTVYVFDTSTTDAGTTISASWDTGYMRLQDVGDTLYLSQIFVNKPVTSNNGTLDCNVLLLLDGSAATISVTALSKTSTRLQLPVPNGTSGRADFLKIQYNVNASPEYGVVEFGDIETSALVERKLTLA